MAAIVSADISDLLSSIVAGDEESMIRNTLALLSTQRVPPARLAARVGIPAAWGGGDGYALSTLSVGGRVAEWMRTTPIGPEPGAEERRTLAPALPLAQGFVAVADRVKQGLVEPHPALPEPLIPRDVQHPDGPLGVLREAVAAHDVENARRILLGYYATGTDYRNILTAIYAALDLRYPVGGKPFSFAVAGSRVLDMADWATVCRPSSTGMRHSWWTPRRRHQLRRRHAPTSSPPTTLWVGYALDSPFPGRRRLGGPSSRRSPQVARSRRARRRCRRCEMALPQWEWRPASRWRRRR